MSAVGMPVASARWLPIPNDNTHAARINASPLRENSRITTLSFVDETLLTTRPGCCPSQRSLLPSPPRCVLLLITPPARHPIRRDLVRPRLIVHLALRGSVLSAPAAFESARTLAR